MLGAGGLAELARRRSVDAGAEFLLIVSLALARLRRGAAEARGPRSAAVPVRHRRAAVQRGPFLTKRSRAASRTRTHFEPLRAYARPTTFIKAGGPAPYAVDAPSWPCGL